MHIQFCVIAILGIALVASVTGAEDEKDPRIFPDPNEDLVGRLRKTLSSEKPFELSRDPLIGFNNRAKMAYEIKYDLQLYKTQADRFQINSTLDIYNFTTSIMSGSNTPQQIGASNLIFVLNANSTTKVSDDKPLLIATNYDTAPQSNYVNDGSGIAAMLTLISMLIKEIDAKKLNLKHSIIFAFTDASVQKYGTHHIPNALSGGRALTDSWLPSYLNGREFRGAIVLDNIMNYMENDNTQIVDGSMDKSFPTSYRNILDQGKKGNFIALVSRDDRYDRPLAEKFAEGWTQSRKQVKAGITIDPRIVPFTFDADTFVSPSSEHLLRSEQYSFWRSTSSSEAKLYPAILITDTRAEYRRAACNFLCGVNAMSTDDNLAFLARTVQSLRYMVLDSQTDANGALPGVQISIIALILSVTLTLWRNN